MTRSSLGFRALVDLMQMEVAAMGELSLHLLCLCSASLRCDESRDSSSGVRAVCRLGRARVSIVCLLVAEPES